jgi:hypothetical protein
VSPARGLAPHTIAVKSGPIIEDIVDGEVVIINAETGTCYALNKVGSRIWALIQEPRRIRDICATLTDEFEVSDAVCGSQVSELITELHAESLVALREDTPENV